MTTKLNIISDTENNPISSIEVLDSKTIKENPYSDSLEHIFDELRCIDILLRTYLSKTAKDDTTTNNKFRGLYIDTEEIESITASPCPFEISNSISDETVFLTKKWYELRNSIEIRLQRSLDAGVILRLEHLRRMFTLSDFELYVLLICIAPEYDLRYEKIYAYIQDDVTKKTPTVSFVLDLLCENMREKIRCRKLFYKSSLIDNHLVELIADPSRINSSLLSSFLRINRRIVEFLSENDTINSSIDWFIDTKKPQLKYSDLVVNNETFNTLLSIGKKIYRKQGSILYLWGDLGIDKLSVADAFCGEISKNYILFRGSVINEREKNFHEIIHRVLLEAKLQENAIIWTDFTLLLKDDRIREFEYVLPFLNSFKETIILIGEQSWEPGAVFLPENFFSIHLPFPTAKERHDLWVESMSDTGIENRIEVLPKVAQLFRMSPRQIRDSSFTAVRRARHATRENALPDEQDLLAACRIHCATKLGELAKKIEPQYGWNDIVLSTEKILHLKELCGSMKFRSQVYEEWGFEKKLSLGKGVHALFAGPSGTGKTMASEIIAKELGVELYKIDLSTIVSKYIGETEKNLSRIFNEAENSNAILFFDEADALMGKRSEVKDAHDRYANIEISYLLQKMEEYSGMSLLATNLRQNIDDAFIRRIRFIIEFPFPESQYRLEIWKRVWPLDTPLSGDVDFDFLAHQFQLSGGNIRNIALNATCIAAEKDSEVNMAHILLSTKRELQKIGKICLDQDFGRYKQLFTKK